MNKVVTAALTLITVFSNPALCADDGADTVARPIPRTIRTFLLYKAIPKIGWPLVRDYNNMQEVCWSLVGARVGRIGDPEWIAQILPRGSRLRATITPHQFRPAWDTAVRMACYCIVSHAYHNPTLANISEAEQAHHGVILHMPLPPTPPPRGLTGDERHAVATASQLHGPFTFPLLEIVARACIVGKEFRRRPHETDEQVIERLLREMSDVTPSAIARWYARRNASYA
jgi:hypothetical protein